MVYEQEILRMLTSCIEAHYHYIVLSPAIDWKILSLKGAVQAIFDVYSLEDVRDDMLVELWKRFSRQRSARMKKRKTV